MAPLPEANHFSFTDIATKHSKPFIEASLRDGVHNVLLSKTRANSESTTRRQHHRSPLHCQNLRERVHPRHAVILVVAAKQELPINTAVLQAHQLNGEDVLG
jgi:hypothetical protein